MKPERLQLLEMPDVQVSAPRELARVNELRVIYDTVQDKYAGEPDSVIRDAFIAMAITIITIKWLPPMLQPFARPVLRWLLGFIYDTIHNLITKGE